MTQMIVQPVPEGGDGGEGGDFTLIPADTMHRAIVTRCAVEKKPFKDKDGNDVSRVEFEFKITDGDFANRRVWGSTSTHLNVGDKCKLRQWVQELMGGHELAEGDALNTDDVVDAKCRVIIEHYEGKDKSQNAVTKARVGQVLRPSSSPPVAIKAYDENPY